MANRIDWEYLVNLPRKSSSRYVTLKLLAEGHTCREIAEIRNVAFGTVKNQVHEIRQIVGAKNTTHLISLAHQVEIL